MTIRLLMIHAAKKDARPGSELGGVAAGQVVAPDQRRIPKPHSGHRFTVANLDKAQEPA